MLPASLMDDWLKAALAEDLGTGDITSEALIPRAQRGRAELVAKEPCVVAGLELAVRCFQLLCSEVKVGSLAGEGSRVQPGAVLAEPAGPVWALLAGERVALNLVQHLSGVATLTRRFVDAVAGTGVRILDTRKTLPGMRMLEKYAVRMGGGSNHRFTLSEGILIKENHIRACGGIRRAVRLVRERAPHTLRVEVEVSNLDEVEEALAAGVDAILVDNMGIEGIREAVKRVAGAVTVEASGGVTLENARAIAETGVDAISVGRITHSAPGVDISMYLTDA